MDIRLRDYFSDNDIITINEYITNFIKIPYNITSPKNYFYIYKKLNILLCCYNIYFSMTRYIFLYNINNIYDFKIYIYTNYGKSFIYKNRSVEIVNSKYISYYNYIISYYNNRNIYKRIEKREKHKIISKKIYNNYYYQKSINNFGIILNKYIVDNSKGVIILKKNYYNYKYNIYIINIKIINHNYNFLFY